MKKCFYTIVLLVASLVILFALFYYGTSINLSRNVIFYKMLYNENREKVLTVQNYGKLGNGIFEYLSLYVLWRNNEELFELKNLKPYIEIEMKESMEGLFQHVAIQSARSAKLFSKERVKYINHTENIYFFSSEDIQFYQLVDYSARYEEILQYGIIKLLDELKFREDILKKIRPFTEEITSNNKTLICAHYRGGDYIKHLDHIYGKTINLPDYRFYIRAFEYFKSKYRNAIFVFITVDMKWLERNEYQICSKPDVICNPSKLPNDTNTHFTFLSSCNGSIINYGTYGVLSALFAGGETIVYDLKKPVTHRGHNLAMAIATYLPNLKWFLGDGNYLQCNYINMTKTCSVN